MTLYPLPTTDQVDRSLDLHGQDVDRATAYLCEWLGVAHPAAQTLIRQKVAERRDHPND